MEIKILDTDFVAISVVENYQSFIWTDRFAQYGDFELYAPMGEEWLDNIQIGYYVSCSDSDRLMIIETVEITSDTEEGDFIKVSGRSLESILARRIVWQQTVVSGNPQACIKKLIDDAIINPAIADRQISNFIFKESTDEGIIGLSMESQYTGDNLYDVIADICTQIYAGFRIRLTEENQFEFELYRGYDMTSEVVFSNEYGNLITSDYTNDTQEYKNVTLVAGDGEGTARKTAVVGNAAGLNRKELFTDARDLSSNNVAAATYTKQLQQRGSEKLAEVSITEGFDGTVEPDIMYQYNLDFSIGDFVTFRDKYGNTGTPRINEFTISNDENNGYYCYPTFTMEE